MINMETLHPNITIPWKCELRELVYASMPYVYATGIFSKIPFVIGYGGEHPCAYVPLGEPTEEYLNLHYSNCPKEITYISPELPYDYPEWSPTEGQYWIGWDYGHLFDYASNKSHWRSINQLVKHSGEEILGHVKIMIDYFIRKAREIK